ncbi:MAG: type II toxin-antitoxin system VapC family toxin [Nitrososphaerales archaeon]
MKLIDTVAIIGFLNPKDRLHARSAEHIRGVSTQDDFFVPVTSLVEADLLMRISGYTDSEREISWRAIESEIPTDKVVPNSASSIHQAVDLQKDGLDYFDSLVAALAKETGSTVITTDKRIGDIVQVVW